MTFDAKNSTFTRSGSFRHTTLTDRYTDPQEIKPGAGKRRTDEIPIGHLKVVLRIKAMVLVVAENSNRVTNLTFLSYDFFKHFIFSFFILISFFTVF